MKVKIISSCFINGNKIAKLNEVLDLPLKEAKELIVINRAIEYTEPEPEIKRNDKAKK